MNNSNIKLISFTADHFEILKDEVPDAEFLMQWAGPKFTFPITWEQMKMQIEDKHKFLFSAEIPGTGIVGHIQFTILDYLEKIAHIGSVLVFSKYRNRGFGKDIMRQILDFGFNVCKMNELRLSVFDFNLNALKCYKNAGFKEYDIEENIREINGRRWNLIRMRIFRDEFNKGGFA